MGSYATIQVPEALFSVVKRKLAEAGYTGIADYTVGDTPTLVLDGFALQPQNEKGSPELRQALKALTEPAPELGKGATLERTEHAKWPWPERKGKNVIAERVPVPLEVIRHWPKGMQERLEAVWKDLVGFIPSYKLYDLQRVLAEFGFEMLVYETGVAQEPTPHNKELSAPPYYISGPYQDGQYGVCEVSSGRILFKFDSDDPKQRKPYTPVDDVEHAETKLLFQRRKNRRKGSVDTHDPDFYDGWRAAEAHHGVKHEQ